MSNSAITNTDDSPSEIPVTPSNVEWDGMTPAARQQFVIDATAALNEQAELMSEGRQHSRIKMGTATVLGDFFERIGRHIYLASELPVLYPGERAFAPDLMAVQDVEDPRDDDLRLGWSVASEGRGVDLALEILYHGDRNKDLVSNVARFARLQIPEYFVYDRLKQRLYGYHLPVPETLRYQSITSRSGRLHSRVLGLDLGVVDGRLRFFYGEALVPESRELIARLDALMVAREQQLEDEMAARQEAERRAEAAVVATEEAFRFRAEAEARAEAETRLRADLEAQLAALLAERGR